VEDIEGNALYKSLDVSRAATPLEIRTAYRQQAKVHHPDKGGDSKTFSKIQHAYEVLSDPHRRKVYDTWARELEFRYVKAVPQGSAQGGEDVLLDEFDSLGLTCDPHTQLVVTCEVCRRPATKECWTCKMSICEFCTLKRHWKDGFPLHWPLINSDHMREKLAKRELESKKKEDARLTDRANPNYRTEAELRDIRAFKDVAYALQRNMTKEARLVTYDVRLARFYMWAQTEGKVVVACRVPTGYSDMELAVNVVGRVLEVQAENSPPLISRRLAEPIDGGCLTSNRRLASTDHRPRVRTGARTRTVAGSWIVSLTVRFARFPGSTAIESIRSEDNTAVVLVLPKQTWGHRWKRLFEGDSDGVRCMQPAYEQFDSEDDVLLSFEVPFWIDVEDVRVEITEEGIEVEVRNELLVKRTFWRNAEAEARSDEYRVVDVAASSWQLEDDIGQDGEKCKLLSLTLVRPPLTDDEIHWKRGIREDNRQAKRAGTGGPRGFRFFMDDEDEHGLEDHLQAACFLESGKTWVPAKPWERERDGVWVDGQVQLLSKEAQRLVAMLSRDVTTRGP